MAYGDKLMGVNDLLAAWQNRSMREGSAQERATRAEREKLQNDMLRQQLEKNKVEMSAILGQGGMPYTSAMSNSASIGYPEYRQEQQRQLAISQMTGRPMPNMGISGVGGGRMSDGESGPSEAETRMANAQADLEEEKARMAQYERQGRGSATRDLLAQQALENQLAGDKAKAEGYIRGAEIKARGQEYNRGYGKIDADLKKEQAETKSDIKAGDDKIKKTQKDVRELAIVQNPIFSQNSELDPKWSKRAKLGFRQYYDQFLALNNAPPTQEEITQFLNDNFPR